ncbi:hypothetical protein JW978_04275 [Candidatus Dojkabacteria bacterium]|nr:hypothetical protein [Candidatus Dojkabacteria bacterium]
MSPSTEYNYIDQDIIENYQQDWRSAAQSLNNLFGRLSGYIGDKGLIAQNLGEDQFRALILERDFNPELYEPDLLPGSYKSNPSGNINVETAYEILYAVFVDVVGVERVHTFMEETQKVLIYPESASEQYRDEVIQIYRDMKELGFTDHAICG